MARRAADEAGYQDRPSEPETPHRPAASDLRARLADLAAAHPSARSYGDRPRGQAENTAAGTEGARARAAEIVSPDRQHVDAAETGRRDYPHAGDIRLTAERHAHILDGDERGGGHRHGIGRPGKTEFPADWDDSRIADAVLAVARSPDRAPEHQTAVDRWRVSGKCQDVEIVAIVESDGKVCTAWPRASSPGVVKNPLKEPDGRA
jgi:hypothetical protein